MVNTAFEEMLPPFCDGTQPPSPSRTGPRYYVSSITGYSGDGGNDSRLGTVYQVCDARYCCAQVYETQSRSGAEYVCAEANAGKRTYLSKAISARRRRATT